MKQQMIWTAIFERFDYNWNREDWPFYFCQYLIGEATEAYTRLSRSDCTNYDIMKEALLRRHNLTDKEYRKNFRESKPDDGETPQQFIVRFKNYLDKWIQLSDVRMLWNYFSLNNLLVPAQRM